MVEVGNTNFRDGKIYFIGNYVDNDIYIGSTTQTLTKRFQNHKDCINHTEKIERKLYAKMREVGKEHFYIEEIEKFPCSTTEELRKRERHYIIERQPILNKAIPTRTKEELTQTQEYKDKKKEQDRNWYLNNKAYSNQKSKEYRENNKEEIKEWKKQHYEENKEEILQKQKQYHQENKEARNAQKREHREKNKDVINAKQRAKCECECGMTYTYGNRHRHWNSKHHQNFLNNH